jgi:hypothetical protein
MENKVLEEQKKLLLDKLTPKQKEYFNSIDWFLNGARASGRTHVSCTVALIHVLNGQTGFVLEHVPAPHDGMKIYTKTLLFKLADEIGLRIKIRDCRNGFLIDRDDRDWKREQDEYVLNPKKDWQRYK